MLKLPSFAVAVCGCLPLFVQVTVSPTWTVIVVGEKLKSTIEAGGSLAAWACALASAWWIERPAPGDDGRDCAAVGHAGVEVVVADAESVLDVIELVVVAVDVVEVAEVVEVDCATEFVDVADVVLVVVPGLALASIVCSPSGTIRTAMTRARRARRRVRGISSVEDAGLSRNLPSVIDRA